MALSGRPGCRRRTSSGIQTNTYNRQDIHPFSYLSERLSERGVARGNVGVEMDNYWFSAAAFGALQAGLPNTNFSDATGLVNWQRAEKSDTELSYMRKAGRIVERIHQRIVEVAESGIRKCDVAAEIFDAGLRYDPGDGHGGDYPAIVPLLPSGTNAAAPHLTWDDTEMKLGEGTFFEVAGVRQRYLCPLSRTVFLGDPPRKFLDAEKAVLEGLEAGLGPGARWQYLRRHCCGVLRYSLQTRHPERQPYGIPDWPVISAGLGRTHDVVASR